MKDLARQFKYLDVITVFFVSFLLISNVVASKILVLGPLSLDGGGLLFPLTYIFGDILTEVYGYKRTRKAIWMGFGANLVMAATFMLVGVLPPAPDWPNQDAYMTILGQSSRIVLASVTAYFIGEFINSFILAKMKILTKGKFLWMRTIGSTIFGEAFDTTVFMIIAFWGVLPFELFVAVGISGYLLKVAIEILFTPFTYLIINFLKKKESEDYYDFKTDFNPFSVRQ
ncbi:MAG TPA: queuosine precursor transporter [Patescibacteria group bacterium]|nr:queuosine precursor transporter [Patescibacteria group bacterium]